MPVPTKRGVPLPPVSVAVIGHVGDENCCWTAYCWAGRRRSALQRCGGCQPGD
jgi:hypothetical protein